MKTILSIFAIGIAAGQGVDPAMLANPPADSWPGYHGDYSGRRHSALTQITPENVGQLGLAWAFQTGQVKRLAVVAKTAPLPWAQRLGYLLELLDAKQPASLLKAYVQENARDWTQLVPGARHARARRAKDWLLYVNAEVESEA